VNVNLASAEAISEGIVGIGPVLAERLVAYREEHGPFGELDDLATIQGIGPSLLAKISDQISLSDEPWEQASENEAVSPPAEFADLIEGPAGDAAEADASAVVEPQPTQEPQAEGPPEPALAVEPMEEEPLAIEAEAASEPEMHAAPASEPEAALAEVEDEEPCDLPEAVAAEAAAALEEEVVAAPHLLDDSILYTRVTANSPLEPWNAPDGPPDVELPDALAFGEEPQPAAGDASDAAPEAIVGEAPIYHLEPDAAPAAEPKGATPPMSDLERPAETTAAAAPPTPPPPPVAVAEPKRGRGFWGGLLLVLLGGALGVILTLVAAIIWSGTVDFAPRAQVDALNRNLGIMQANQELGWERLDALTAQNQELGRKLALLEPLPARVDAVEQDLTVAQAHLAATQQELTQLGDDVADLRDEVQESLARVDERLAGAEEQLLALDASLSALQAAFARVEKRVQSFDGFFTNLRDLLIDMQGPPPAPVEEPEVVTPEVTATVEATPALPEITPTPTPTASG
jgi:competence ComEA-like helix-hairpin-helix protein